MEGAIVSGESAVMLSPIHFYVMSVDRSELEADEPRARQCLSLRGAHIRYATSPTASRLPWILSALVSSEFGWRRAAHPLSAAELAVADVVSVVDNVSRCQQLTSDFRNENFVKAWKEDVLQLYNVLWYAWLSSREARDRRIKEEEEKRKVEEARQKHLKSLQDGATRHSPGRSHFWAMSSVRDEEPLREGSVSSRASPAPIPMGRVSADVPVYSPATQHLAGRSDVPANGTSGTGSELPEGAAAAAAAAEDEAPEKNGRGPPVDMKQTLALRLLSASLSAPDAPPPPAPRNPSAGSKVPVKTRSLAQVPQPLDPRE